MAADGRIDALCDAVGIVQSYRDGDGRTQVASEDGKRFTLEALGIGVGSDAQIADSLTHQQARARRPVPELLTIDADRSTSVALRDDGVAEWSIVTEIGETHGGRASPDAPWLNFPALTAGYHRLTLTTRNGPIAATILAAPPQCYLPEVLATGEKAWGATAQVYSLRGDHDLGVGTYDDVETLARLVGKRGGAFLGLSPVHALFGSDPLKYSPYSPSSRLFLQTGLIAPHAVAGYAELDAGEPIGPSSLIDYPKALSRQRAVLDAVWARTQDAAARDSDAFRRVGGERLEQHATFEALSEHFKQQGAHWLGEWPTSFRDVHSPDVAAFVRDHPERIAFHVWLQWLADTQLASAAAAAKTTGMSIGLYRDLAVGADRGGSEVWCAPDSFVATLSVGAPPDPLGPLGQDWGLPPLHPLVLASSGLAAFRDLAAANMRHAGAIRIDHAFQLQRLFVLPLGGAAKDGVYLSYPLDALLASLKIESHRAHCLVIGEDLGTAPPGFSDRIMDAGMLSYRLLPFERGEGGVFKTPSAYPSRALAAVSTHDLPTFAGWWRSLDVDVRECLGVFDPLRAAHEREARKHDRSSLIAALAIEGLAPESDVDRPPDIAAMRYLARSPCLLAAVQLEEILREQQQANLPGPDCGHPNWRRRSSASIATLNHRPGLDRVAAAMATEGRASGTPLTPVAAGTYRLQLHASFTFDDAATVVPYLARLGVSHVYTSPIQTSAPGSTHGYDVVDPSRIDPELGGLEGFLRFSDAVRAHGLRLLVDIVPNHVGVGGKSNPWWLDLLEWGKQSPHAKFFDIDWEKPGADGKLIVPFLGESMETLLSKRHIGLGFEAALGRFAVWYAEHCHPVSLLDYGPLLARVRVTDDDRAALQALQDDFATLSKTTLDAVALQARAKASRQHLAHASAASPSLRAALERVGDTLSAADLRDFCARQAWRLVHWTQANALINYRRFFDITSLAGVRVEDPDVFEASHKIIFDLVEDGRIDGLRVDHVDGLADPAQYLRRLQERVGPGFFIAVEKILEPGEHLPRWPIAGTTGYDALHTLDALFFAQSSLGALDTLERDFAGPTSTRDDALAAIKGDLLSHTFVSEFDALVSDLDAALGDRRGGGVAEGLRALLAAFPVYRTYGDVRGFSDADRAVLAHAMDSAMQSRLDVDRPAMDAIVDALSHGGSALRRFQQLTGPLMAKSFEDTLFYRDVRFIAANEVGCGPAQPGIDAAEFHRANAERLRDWPASMIATATHDTKRGEDARGRLLAASHDPQAWEKAARTFCAHAPDTLAKADVYFLFQSLTAACPIEPDERERAEFTARTSVFVEKFLREGKLRSSWTAPRSDYEAAVRDFVEHATLRGGVLFGELAPYVRTIALAGANIGIARTVLKCTVPGIPDIYQGSELADLSFVDPDNRRPVDYSRRDGTLGKPFDLRDGAALLAGEGKLLALTTLLRDRREHPATYAGAYAPLATGDERAAIAFMRGSGADALCVVVRRAISPLDEAAGMSNVVLPDGEWRNLFDGRTLLGGRTLKLGAVLEQWPAAVLRRPS